MAQSIKGAFNEFFENIINISSRQSDNAKNSKNFLIDQIQSLSNNGNFLKLDSQYNIGFGSFARKTKIQPLDDIDLIIALNGEGLSLEGTEWNNITIKVTHKCNNRGIVSLSDKVPYYWQEDILNLNSNKVKNKLVSALQNISQYEKSEIHARGEAVTLKLRSYPWSFDIVPAFYYAGDQYNTPFYLIPNGYGKWKKTNPKLEQARVSNLNKKFNNIFLKVVRLIKYWNRRGLMPTITSYVLETIVLDYFDQASHNVVDDGKSYDYPDIHFRDALKYIRDHITSIVHDSKGIQNDINNLNWGQKIKIQTRATTDYQKSYDAVYAEVHEKNVKKSMNIWRDIFGGDFPQYD